MSNKKAITKRRFLESDLATLINDRMLEIQTGDGQNFKSLHTYQNVVTVRIGNQTFLISVTEKERLS